MSEIEPTAQVDSAELALGPRRLPPRTPETVVIGDFTPATRSLRNLPGPSPDAPLISILILSLNGRDLLNRLFGSFEAANTYSNFEFLVVDHGSSDNSIELLRDWRRRLPIKILARGANFSFSESNNKAARLAEGSLLMLLNNDVVFVMDCLPGMVRALADPSIGAVGLKQFQGLPDSLEPRRIYHLGVRYGWNLVERRLRPYHVRPSALDARVMQSVAALPAVTASALLCRREEYIAMGGLSEAYVYGLEDVDFCCKVRGRLGKEVVCYNEAFAFHPKNETRNRDPARRRPLEKENRRVLQTRCGYAIRRDFITSRFGDDGSLTGRPFTIGIAANPTDANRSQEVEHALVLGESLRQSFGWKVLHLGPDAWSDASDLDVYISFSPSASPPPTESEPHLVRICSLLGPAEPWLEQPDFDSFNLRLCVGEDVRASIAEEFGAAESFEGAGADQARQIHDWLARVFGGYRLALKIGSTDQIPRARMLRNALVRRGRMVRIDHASEWYAPASLADDVVLALDGGYRPSSDQINLRLGAPDADPSGAGWDGLLLKGRPKSRKRGEVPLTVLPMRAGADVEAQIILELCETLHEERVHGPCDPPLSNPRSAAARGAVADVGPAGGSGGAD